PVKENVGNNEGTDELIVPVGTVTVGERVNDGSKVSLSDYQISISCVNTATDNPVSTTGSNPEFTLSLAKKENVKCTITNRRPMAHLTVVKELDPTTDPGRFDLLVNGTPEAQGVPDNGTNSTGQLTVAPGNVKVGEQVHDTVSSSITLDQYN